MLMRQSYLKGCRCRFTGLTPPKKRTYPRISTSLGLTALRIRDPGLSCSKTKLIPWAPTIRPLHRRVFRPMVEGRGGPHTHRTTYAEEADQLKNIIEEKEVSINSLKKQVEKVDRSRYDICEVFTPP